MGLYIKGMRMPENCFACPFIIEEDIDFDISLQCGAGKNGYIQEEDTDGFPADCPLVDLGKHGDLIDKNSLKETLDYYIREAGWGEEINKALGWVKDDFINSEPTLIEAEDEA